MNTARIDDVCDYVIARTIAGDAELNLLKLQKLLYYVQAWHLAFHGEPLFAGRFQAWVHGPVNREIYVRFKGTKSLYSDVTEADVRPDFDAERTLQPSARSHIDSVLETYAQYTGTQLEEMTHREHPWLAARAGYKPSERCESEIDEKHMAQFYRARLST
ncbi:MAG TPA: type II toxin-antitoxin system antitoxin SocA domain-containing protein [Polyangiaceae bacterium]|jgi:uncharacterized phage-associated protein|nr:type II toxin-antitoxin system antitoxin SocA domain-containing protein [Polyangiaceae bacterium]